MTVDPNFHFGICMCLVDETFLEFHHFEHLLQALMKPDGFHLHLLAPAYHPQYNLFYCVSYHLARLPGFMSSSRWHNGVTATVGFDTIPPINFRILLCFNLDIIAILWSIQSHVIRVMGQIYFWSLCFKWPMVELVALAHSRISRGWKFLSYKVPLLANTW